MRVRRNVVGVGDLLERLVIAARDRHQRLARCHDVHVAGLRGRRRGARRGLPGDRAGDVARGRQRMGGDRCGRGCGRRRVGAKTLPASGDAGRRDRRGAARVGRRQRLAGDLAGRRRLHRAGDLGGRGAARRKRLALGLLKRDVSALQPTKLTARAPITASRDSGRRPEYAMTERIHLLTATQQAHRAVNSRRVKIALSRKGPLNTNRMRRSSLQFALSPAKAA